jgi:ribosomal protein S18 acetylase RimI-like enzyme
MQTIALIEELAANAVPAEIVQELDGWRLRFNGGATRRANSVLAARHAPHADLEVKLAAAEAFYHRRKARCRFQLCPASAPANLDALLAARGYTDTTPTLVQIAPLDALLAPAPYPAQVTEQFDEAWLAAYVAGEGERNPAKIAARRRMLQLVGPPAGFATATLNGELAAVAFGVAERGWLGVFSVATRPELRGRGLAGAALGALATWAARQGVTQAYLQVMSVNAPALRLYERLGFRTCYAYHYREAPWAD